MGINFSISSPAGPNTVFADTFLEDERLRNRYHELDDTVLTLSTSLLARVTVNRL